MHSLESLVLMEIKDAMSHVIIIRALIVLHATSPKHNSPSNIGLSCLISKLLEKHSTPYPF